MTPKRYTVPGVLADASATGVIAVEGMLVVTPWLTFLVEKVGDCRGVLVIGNDVRGRLEEAPADPTRPPGFRGPTPVHGVNIVEFIGIARVVGHVGHAGIGMFPRLLFDVAEFDYEDADSGRMHFELPRRR